MKVAKRLQEERDKLLQEGYVRIDIEDSTSARAEFYALYGGMFILGILLGLVFIVGMVLIMYYKQVTEGYEDQKRFDIMQKVGMTKREIRKSINSQVLTVFFLPLLAAGIHTAFAFPMIQKILLLFRSYEYRASDCGYGGLLSAVFSVLYYYVSGNLQGVLWHCQQQGLNGFILFALFAGGHAGNAFENPVKMGEVGKAGFFADAGDVVIRFQKHALGMEDPGHI